jgi:Ca2+-binding RTX toxin-like protein
MRRVILLLTVIGATLIVASGVALAAVVQCVPGATSCDGTDQADQISGTNGPDQVFARDGSDTVEGLDDADLLLGGDGNDDVLGDDGDDLVEGGSGEDLLEGGDDEDEIDARDGFPKGRDLELPSIGFMVVGMVAPPSGNASSLLG